MPSISDTVRQQVRQRAENRCEYCLSAQDYVMGKLQIDHIQPKVKGGSDERENLCLACELCNQHKWTKTEDLDPQTREIASLFNPRQQNWQEHFAWSEDATQIMGLTACGRATVIALKLNNALAVMVRRNWVRAGWHPPT
ncbi:HNH endonuclease [Lusitaniella coriacea]|uniref:HNH endonuclease n=1 Tax=Lusitaniella coriacea TaxID=1983105 RepID=UPI003CF331D6